MSGDRGLAFGCICGALALVASCGSRSGLSIGGAPSASGGAGGTVAAGGTTPSGGAGGSGAAGGSGGSGLGPADAGPDVIVPPPPPCALVAAGPAVDVLSFPDRHATAASAVTIAGGSSAATARVALQALASGGDSPLHSDIQLASFSVGEPWPDGIWLDNAPQLFGVEAHGWANLVNSPSGSQLALGWHGDPGGFGRPMFRLWNLGIWLPQPSVDLAPGGEAVLDMASGAGIGAMGVGYGGLGYAVVWRDVLPAAKAPTRPVAAITNEAGDVLFGPHALSEYIDYPGRSPSVVWTGLAYVAATSTQSCTAGESLCQPVSVVITRLRPASGDLVDDSGIDLVAALATKGPLVGRAALSHHAGRTFVAWTESDVSTLGEPRRIRIAELSPLGEVISGTVSVDEAAPMVSRVTLRASALGVAVTWAEDADTTLPDNVVGRSRIVTTHLTPDLGLLSYRISVPTTRFDGYGPPHATPLEAPKSLLVVWSGLRIGSGYQDVWATRLDCAP